MPGPRLCRLCGHEYLGGGFCSNRLTCRKGQRITDEAFSFVMSQRLSHAVQPPSVEDPQVARLAPQALQERHGAEPGHVAQQGSSGGQHADWQRPQAELRLEALDESSACSRSRDVSRSGDVSRSREWSSSIWQTQQFLEAGQALQILSGQPALAQQQTQHAVQQPDLEPPLVVYPAPQVQLLVTAVEEATVLASEIYAESGPGPLETREVQEAIARLCNILGGRFRIGL